MGRFLWKSQSLLFGTIFLCGEALKHICSEFWGCVAYYLKTTYLVQFLQFRYEKIQTLESKMAYSGSHRIGELCWGEELPIS